jgi:hypothetical protein
LTTTKNKDYYNSVLIEPIKSEPINSEPINSEPSNEEPSNEEPSNEEPSTCKDLNNDFTYEMKNELNNFISKIKT